MSLPSISRWPADETYLPHINGDECFGDLAEKLSQSGHPQFSVYINLIDQ
jgi:hypothetical protein